MREISEANQAQNCQLQSDIVQVVPDEINEWQQPGTPSAPAQIDLLWQKRRIY